jgi:hypothetical protein
MAHLNSNTPNLQVYVRNEFLYNQEKGHGEYTQGWVVGIRSVKGMALTFLVLLVNGVLFTGLPVSALCSKPCEKQNIGDLQLWDCLSYDHNVVEYSFLKNMNCSVYLKDKTKNLGKYLFTVDFCNSASFSGLSETPNEWKMFHFVELDNGNYCLYPQNRIQFIDASICKLEDVATLGYKVNQTKYICEDGNKWSVCDDETYLYGIYDAHHILDCGTYSLRFKNP